MGVTFSVLSTLMLMSCSSNAPYIYDANEFDRESAKYGKDIIDRSNVTICYDTSGTTPAIITQMANSECQKFGKTALFSHQSYQTCPLLTPAAATYICK